MRSRRYAEQRRDAEGLVELAELADLLSLLRPRARRARRDASR